MAAVLAPVARAEDADFWLEEAARRTVREMKALVVERQNERRAGAVEALDEKADGLQHLVGQGLDEDAGELQQLEAEEDMRTLTITCRARTQYARERLGTSHSSIKDKRQLARRLGQLRFLANAVDRGELGYEAARLVAGVATPQTEEAWVERAKERTLRHLREEIVVAELQARWPESPDVLSQSDADVRRVEELERAVVAGQMSAPPPPPASAPLAKVTLRLRVRASTASDFRH